MARQGIPIFGYCQVFLARRSRLMGRHLTGESVHGRGSTITVRLPASVSEPAG
jgi:hypothetical protein